MSIISPFVAWLERRCARSRLFFYAYAAPYRRLVARELRLAGVDSRHTLVHIGCGSLPFTAVLAARISGCRVIAVDSDEQAARNARATVRRLGLEYADSPAPKIEHHEHSSRRRNARSGSVEVIVGTAGADSAKDRPEGKCDELTHRLRIADVVLVALQAAPKQAIYRQLSCETPEDAALVFRLARPGLEAEYGCLEAGLEGNAPFCRHAMPTFNRSVLFSERRVVGEAVA